MRLEKRRCVWNSSKNRKLGYDYATDRRRRKKKKLITCKNESDKEESLSVN